MAEVERYFAASLPDESQGLSEKDAARVRRINTDDIKEYVETCRTLNVYPHVVMALNVIAWLPMSSAHVESVFSLAGWIDAPRRARLAPDTLAALTFCAC
jgi:hypothetical protein